MLSPRLLLTLIALAAAVSACGDEEPAPRQPGGDAELGARERGSLPSKPQVVLHLDRERRGLPERVRAAGGAAGFDHAGYRLRLAGEGALRVPAPPLIRPSTRAVLIQATIRLPAAPARAGVACRARADGAGGYELAADRDGRFKLDRVDGRDRETLRRGRVPIDPEPPRPDTPVTLLCGAGVGSQGVSIGYSLGAQELSFVRDPKPLAPPGPGRPALALGDGPGAATVEGLAVSVAR